MKRKFRSYLKLNLVSLFFITISFVSATFAWFAYTGSPRVNIDVQVKAWNIILERDGERITHDLLISVDEIFPGMETITELVKVINVGDSDAIVNYEIISARALDMFSYTVPTMVTSDYLEDMISHDLPFSINVSLSNHFIKTGENEAVFEVSISWPLDSDRDELDSQWGTEAYNFQKSEQTKQNSIEGYQVRPAIQIAIKLSAEQALDLSDATDPSFNNGDLVLIDVINNTKCFTINDTCLNAYVLDINSKVNENTITLLPNPYSAFLSGDYLEYDDNLSAITSEWNIETRGLRINDILPIIALDVKNSFLIRPNLSDAIVGYVKTDTRLATELTKAISYNGYYQFSNERFAFLGSGTCYWLATEYNEEKAFAVQNTGDNITKIFGNNKSSNCKTIPVIVTDKANLK